MNVPGATGISTTIVATLIVALRLFTRLSVTRQGLGLDDCLNLAALVLVWVFLGGFFPFYDAIDNLFQAQTEENNRRFEIYNAVTGIAFTTALALSKLSILVFYLRLSPVRSHRYPVYILMSLLCLYTLGCNIFSLLIFSPLAQKVKDADTIFTPLYAIGNIVIDFCILLLPIRAVLPLQMSAKRKVLVLMIFTTGTVVCAFAIWRATCLTFISKSLPTKTAISKELAICFGEVNGGVICAAVPSISAFFTKFLPDVYASYVKGSQSSSSIGNSPFSTTESKNVNRRQTHEQSYKSRSHEAVSTSHHI
ncbi:uncharacterized protein BCR38DRAFT_77195 [Pseudomassariella vexata]|uniref:Rhodopsin domain-containing protein n=1 Tax=Pseudomassariella vexata TaxID=1141098 RepID=A0A1Y2DFY5_9PEZI|nr:uncharacterized protein BCR38DRAFT_77195 [Pseudomassariella vexata]ORY58139.1 hypothetical protein BCR38DRAFT_77195 [Pseudomassariella vexata]